ncbi:cadmium-translocating P-type ATPase [Candidatus Saccharibacteria bacterium]|nr:cadmium-translocating P-type ATPase [Candidatus Saccharibacteria bacterium]
MNKSGYAAYLIFIFSIIVAALLGIGMLRDLFRGHYGVDILAVTAIASTLWVGEYWATIVIVIMLLGGEALEQFAQSRAKAELTALLARAPTKAHKLMVDGTTRDVPIDSILRKDNIVVKPGEVIPVDAVVVIGESSLDESSLTGESEQVPVRAGDQVMSGAINTESPLVLIATNEAGQSQYARIIELVKAASDSRAPFVRMADRYAVPFTFIAFMIAGLAWYTSGDATRFAAVLVVATPCPLLLAAPIALISGMSRAAKHGIIIKNGGVLERLASVRAAAFDKTGTLTNGELNFKDLIPAKGVTPQKLLEYTASAMQASNHAIAQAIMIQAKAQQSIVHKAIKQKEYPGGGIRCVVGRDTVLVGRRDFLVDNGVLPSSVPEHSGTAVYVAQNKQYIGMITFSDTLRSDSKSTIASLTRLGIANIVMLTGDKRVAAQYIARDLGITEIHAECLPVDKVNIVREYSVRPIMMVGDGVNDAPVLAASDVGVAMGARGATAASESADVVIMLDSISRAATAVEIAKRTITVARQSVLLGIFISIGLMIVAAFGFVPAIIGALLQEFVDVAVILNALRAHKGVYSNAN